jgi:S-adenosylmethionine hydrolase
MMMRFREASMIVITLGMAMLASAQLPQSLVTTIAEVEQEYANILLDASPRELRSLGVTVGTKFIFMHNGQSYTATLVEEYGDVEIGAWLGRIWEERVELAISFGNACTVLDCKVGDAVTISPGGTDNLTESASRVLPPVVRLSPLPNIQMHFP